MVQEYWNFAEVRFIDRQQVIRDLRVAIRDAKARFPGIIKVLLFGSYFQGNWTADSDADLIVVVRRDFPSILDRSPYQIFTPAILTDSLVYSKAEFEKMARDPSSFLAPNISTGLEL